MDLPDLTNNVTKRFVIFAQLYDPLALLSPLTIKAEIFLQSLWMKNLEWDNEVDGSLFLEWQSIHRNLLLTSGFLVT